MDTFEQLPVTSSDIAESSEIGTNSTTSNGSKHSFSNLKLSQSYASPSFGSGVLSPVTDLALNLNSLTTKSSFTPKRRISWSSDTPTKPFLPISNLCSDSPCYVDSPTFQDRLFKKVNINHTNVGGTTRTSALEECSPVVPENSAPAGPASPSLDSLTIHRTSLRRMRSLPAWKSTSTGIQPLAFEKENVTPRLTDQNESDIERPKDASEELEISYTIPLSVVPGSPISTSPLGLKHFTRRSNSIAGLSEYYHPCDSDSQDSGCILSADERSSLNSLVSSSSSDSIPGSRFQLFPEPQKTAPRKSKLEESSSKLDVYEGQFLLRRPSNCSSVRSSILADNEEDDDDFDDGFLDVFNDEKEDAKYSNELVATHRFRDLLTQPIVNQIGSNDEKYGQTVQSKLPLTEYSPEVDSLRHANMRRSFSMMGRIESNRDRITTWSNELIENDENQSSNVDLSSSSTVEFSISRKRIFESGCDKLLPFKRPEPPGESGFSLETKRRKSVSVLVAARKSANSVSTPNAQVSDSQGRPHKSPIQRSQSMSDVHIDSALRRSEQEANLTGDYASCHVLPVLKGRHPDLKTISAETLRQLVSGNFRGVQCFTVVDCRYPYEYNGGHIQGAKNIFTKDKIYSHFLVEAISPGHTNIKTDNMEDPSSSQENEQSNSPSNTRHVLIFHCEFSSERGPNLIRFLRKKDREVNKDQYPHLFYPEIYLLEGGYKNFFTTFKEFCEPQQYLPMNHKDHREDLCHFRAKSKSWNGDSKTRSAFRPGLLL